MSICPSSATMKKKSAMKIKYSLKASHDAIDKLRSIRI